MGSMRDGLPSGVEYSFVVVAIGPNYEGELAMCLAYGGDYGSCPRSRWEAELERDRILEKWRNRSSRPDYWSPAIHLEIWTMGQVNDAVDSGNYAPMLP